MKAKYTTNAECTIKNIRNYLKKCNHNIVIEEENDDFSDDEFFEILRKLANEYEKENDHDND